mgnify:CR=1 FL=1
MKTMTARRLWLAGICALTTLAACGGEKGGREEKGERGEREHSEASEAKRAPDAKVYEVEMYSDEKGNYFKPTTVTARKGDVIKFELKVGVHNVNFLADSNPGKTGLPKVSEFLQLPGQELEIVIGMEPGTYYFQCDPHAALGMKGHLTVVPR